MPQRLLAFLELVGSVLVQTPACLGAFQSPVDVGLQRLEDAFAVLVPILTGGLLRHGIRHSRRSRGRWAQTRRSRTQTTIEDRVAGNANEWAHGASGLAMQ